MVRIKLDEFLAERGISRYQLAKMSDTKYQTIDNYYKNKVVRYDSFILSKICDALQCEISDVLEYIKD